MTFEEDAVRKTTPPTRRAHHFAPRTQAIALEPRILFDAALPAAAAEAYRPPENTQPADDAPVPAHPGNDRSPAHPTEKTAAPQQLPEPTKEIAFVDQAISNWQSLVAEVPPGLEIVYLDPASAPLARIASELEQRGGDFSAVHLVSHGAAGRLNLAGWRVDGAHLGTAVGELARIGAQLTSNADLLLYGCEVAADENGRQFMAALAAATGADVAAAFSGAIGAMSGPLHGGAPSRVLGMIEDVERTGDARGYVKGLLDQGERLMGFGHRVYRAEDPRARVLRRTARELNAPRYAVAEELEKAALAELRERRPDRVLETNVEFWAAIVLDFAEVPAHMFTSMFTCARTGGWSAHILEQKTTGRLIRPSALYTGPASRPADSVEGWNSAWAQA